MCQAHVVSVSSGGRPHSSSSSSSPAEFEVAASRKAKQRKMEDRTMQEVITRPSDAGRKGDLEPLDAMMMPNFAGLVSESRHSQIKVSEYHTVKDCIDMGLAS